jgi:hypothetical protein
VKKQKSEKKKPEFILYNFIKSKLRSAYKKLPAYSEALALAKREYFVTSKHGKQMRRVHFECAMCKRCFKGGSKKEPVLDPETGEQMINPKTKKPWFKKIKSEIAVDHIEAIINPETGFVDYNDMIKRMFCGVEGLQVLCNYAGERDGRKSCHAIKSAEERAVLAQTNKRLKAEGKSVTTKDR